MLHENMNEFKYFKFQKKKVPWTETLVIDSATI
jgi:hypothetical protein